MSTGELLPERRLSAVPTPIRKRAIDLATLTDLRREMSRVYRDVRLKRVAPEVGAKLTFMLVSIARVTELAEVQPRVEAIERVITRRPCG
jgi:hypothetical protein